jgi:hypothetical protein
MAEGAAAANATAAGLRLLVELTNAALTAEQRRWKSREAAVQFQRAMELLKNVAAQRLPAKSVNPGVTLATAERLARTLAKLTALLRRRRLSPRFQQLLLRLTALEQAQASLVAQLERAATVRPPAGFNSGFTGTTVTTPGLK